MTKPSVDNPSGQPLGLPLNDQLGPLPETTWHPQPWERAFSADHMHAYAAQEVAAERERWAKEPLTRQQIDAVMTEHYPLDSLLRENVDAFEACVRDIERLHGIGA